MSEQVAAAQSRSPAPCPVAEVEVDHKPHGWTMHAVGGAHRVHCNGWPR